MEDEVEEDEEEEHKFRKLEELAIIDSINQRTEWIFQRNANLSHVVHAVMGLGQFLSVLATELFHHIHHAINRMLREKDEKVPILPEERNPIFIAYPICMIISLLLSVLWLRFKTFERILDTSLVGCAIGIILMLISAILSMHHAELYINLEEVSDEELLKHPIFIHNFIICIISILAVVIYFIHFWILYDCWLWRKKNRSVEDSNSSSQSQEESRRSPEPSTSRKHESAKKRVSDPSISSETLEGKMANLHEVNWENEPVILYCCCVDFWNYMKEKETQISDHEFQVVHIM